ncbi:hypothetical protein MYX84_08970 [Acidobacteria bacterium AH-259-O06]|nr:hypothetical protein [Acidobacteria bacterium AH-259-O06]
MGAVQVKQFGWARDSERAQHHYGVGVVAEAKNFHGLRRAQHRGWIRHSSYQLRDPISSAPRDE